MTVAVQNALPMRAIVQSAYGPPDVLRLTEAARPEIPAEGVLVRVHAVGLNKGDWHLMTGTPYLVRLMFGLTAPRRPIPGMAVSGRVEAVGAGVLALRVGDEVFGELKGGGLAEYVCATEAELAIKPPALGFDDAAALPIAATTALQGLRDAGGLQPGQSILVNGAAGGVGTFAVQIAKAMGAVVTGVCSAGNVARVRDLGADHVIDYGSEDFTKGQIRYDLIFDLIGNHPVSACRKVLTPNGRFLACAGGAQHTWIGPMLDILLGLASNLYAAQKFVPVVARPDRADLAHVADLVATGKVRPVFDRRYTLAETAEAMRYVGTGHTCGKNIITL